MTEAENCPVKTKPDWIVLLLRVRFWDELCKRAVTKNHSDIECGYLRIVVIERKKETWVPSEEWQP